MTRWPSSFRPCASAARAYVPELGDTEVHIWWISLDVDDARLETYRSVLSACERDRASQFASPPLRSRFTARRALLRIILSAYGGLTADRLEFDIGPNGKPSLRAGYGSLYFSASSSGGNGLVAVTRLGLVGIDLERVRDDFEGPALARNVFSLEEVQSINASAHPQREFFKYWTCKEAFVKATGKGLSMPLNQFEVRPINQRFDAGMIIAADQPHTPEWHVYRLSLTGDYEGALALRCAGPQLTLSSWVGP